MKKLINTVLIMSTLALVSCGHMGMHHCSDKSQCDMKKQCQCGEKCKEQCQMKGEQCPMTKGEATKEAPKK